MQGTFWLLGFALVLTARGQEYLSLPFLDLDAAAMCKHYLPALDDGFSRPISIPSGFPFGSAVHYVVYISTNGYFSFGRGVGDCCPPLSFGLPQHNYSFIVAPFWADINIQHGGGTGRGGEIVYAVLSKEDQQTLGLEVDSFISTYFSQTYLSNWTLVVQWKDVVPYSYDENPPKNSFQAILTTNGISSFYVFTYPCGSLEWAGDETDLAIGFIGEPGFHWNFRMTTSTNAISCSFGKLSFLANILSTDSSPPSNETRDIQFQTFSSEHESCQALGSDECCEWACEGLACYCSAVSLCQSGSDEASCNCSRMEDVCLTDGEVGESLLPLELAIPSSSPLAKMSGSFGLTDGVSEAIEVPNGFPFGTTTKTVVYVGVNGYISFDSRVMIGSPKLFPYGPSYFVAVYWAEVDQEEGEVVCETHDDSNGNDESSSSNSSSSSSSSSSSALILQQVSSYIGNGSSSSSDGWQQQPFAGKWMLLCTWKDMVQKNAANKNQTNTFQGVVVTDGVESYSVFLYRCCDMQWSGDATVGFNVNGVQFWNHPLSGHPDSSAIACLMGGGGWGLVVRRLTVDNPNDTTDEFPSATSPSSTDHEPPSTTVHHTDAIDSQQPPTQSGTAGDIETTTTTTTSTPETSVTSVTSDPIPSPSTNWTVAVVAIVSVVLVCCVLVAVSLISAAVLCGRKKEHAYSLRNCSEVQDSELLGKGSGGEGLYMGLYTVNSYDANSTGAATSVPPPPPCPAMMMSEPTVGCGMHRHASAGGTSRTTGQHCCMQPNWMDMFAPLLVKGSQVRLKTCLGEGAFGKVFEGTLSSNEISEPLQVAVKTIKGKLSQQEVEDFIAESAIMLDFDHPNVMGLLGVCFKFDGDQQETPLILLPFMCNGDLRTFLSSKRQLTTMDDIDYPDGLDSNQLLLMCLDIARGMEYLAKMRFVHRDLAARNCMVDQHLSVKVADFGMSRDVYKSEYYRLTHKAMLPVKWLPPESLLDNIYNEKTDVWSFGVACWEVFSLGRTPYAGMSNIEMPGYICSGKRLRKPSLCPTGMYRITFSCWLKDPKDRPSFQGLVKAISSSLMEEAAAADGSNSHGVLEPIRESPTEADEEEEEGGENGGNCGLAPKEKGDHEEEKADVRREKDDHLEKGYINLTTENGDHVEKDGPRKKDDADHKGRGEHGREKEWESKGEENMKGQQSCLSGDKDPIYSGKPLTPYCIPAALPH